MPALNITFTDDEMEDLRTSATALGQSLKTFTHEAALRVARDDEYRRRVTAAAHFAAHHFAELNERLK